MMTDRLDEIEQRLKAADGRSPWGNRVTDDRRWAEVFPMKPGVDGRFVARCIDDDEAELIAHAPTDISWLLAEVKRLREVIAGSPDKAKRLASLVAASTRLVRIERDDALARVRELEAEKAKGWADVECTARVSWGACGLMASFDRETP